MDTGLLQENALDYFCFVGNEKMTKERRNAAFNVQEENFGFWADLILENNRETMYYAKSAVEENLYISNRQHVLVPTSSLETTWAYYGDGRNYDWSIGQNVYDGESAYCLEPTPVKMTETEMDALADAIAEETKPSPFGPVDLFEGDYVTLNLTSKDKVLQGTMQIAKYQGKWYGLGESLDMKKDQWSIIAAELPKSIGDKIDKAL